MSIVVVSWDKVGRDMAGSAVRAYELASALARRGLAVELLAPPGSELPANITTQLSIVTRRGDASAAALLNAADAVVIPGRMELMNRITRPCIIDLYDPFILSDLEFFGNTYAGAAGRPLLGLRWLQHHLKHGDFFICASDAQRKFWLGMLAAAGRLNRLNYDQDPEFRRLIDIVPFGIPREKPVQSRSAIRGVIAGIDEGDKIVLWAGGLWNWVDPLTLIRAMAMVRATRSDVKCLIVGVRHPNPEIGEMDMARQAIALARELGLYEQGVSFVDWLPYSRRQEALLESDIGISLHGRGVESEFAFRTRILDYIWAGLPMVLTSGDELSGRVERDRLGAVVSPGDATAVASAILALLDDGYRHGMDERFAALSNELAWDRVIAPLSGFCADARRAADKEVNPWFGDATARQDLPGKDAVLIAEEFVDGRRRISRQLGPAYKPIQCFRAAYDRLCQIDVLMWVEPPTEGANLTLEIRELGHEGAPDVRVVVPATQLSSEGWQAFNFRPIENSAGRHYEFTLILTETDTAPATMGVLNEWALGRVCVWQRYECAPPPGLVFVARYLIDGILSDVPVPSDSFLFLHGLTLPLKGAISEAFPIVALESHDGTSIAADAARLRLELARVAVQSAAAQEGLERCERVIARVAEEVDARVEKMMHERLDAYVDERVIASVKKGAGDVASSAVGHVEARVAAMERGMREANGRLEDLGFALRDIGDRTNSIEGRVSDIERAPYASQSFVRDLSEVTLATASRVSTQQLWDTSVLQLLQYRCRHRAGRAWRWLRREILGHSDES